MGLYGCMDCVDLYGSMDCRGLYGLLCISMNFWTFVWVSLVPFLGFS